MHALLIVFMMTGGQLQVMQPMPFPVVEMCTDFVEVLKADPNRPDGPWQYHCLTFAGEVQGLEV